MDIKNIIDTRDMSYLLAPAIRTLEMIQRRIEEARQIVEPKPLDKLRAQWDAQHGAGDHYRLEAEGAKEAEND